MYTGADIVIEPSSRRLPLARQHWFGPTEFEIQGMAWTLGEFKSDGADGQVYQMTLKESKKQFVAKFVQRGHTSEVELVKSLPPELVVHENLVKYEMIVVDVQQHFAPAQDIVIMEHIPNGELFDLLVSDEESVRGRPVSAGTSRRFLRDVISGMAACYRSRVTHRDLKPENLLIDEMGRIVIIDMGHAAKKPSPPSENADTDGCSALTGPPMKTYNSYGTPAFNAPEVQEAVLQRRQYDCEPADVWSVGVIAFYLHAKLPLPVEGRAIVRMQQDSGPDNTVLWQTVLRNYPVFPEGLRGFINSLWRADPLQRPSFEQLEKAMGGDGDALEKFPGLRWLAEPVNDASEFVKELRRHRPDLEFREPPPAAPAGALGDAATKPSAEPRAPPAAGWLARCCGWCSG